MIRRVDNLGRIVIPKEIRKSLKIKENEQVEIKILDNSIILNPYSELDKNDIYLKKLIDSIKEVYNIDILITNLNYFVITTNEFKELNNKEISLYLNEILDNRKEIIEYDKKNISLSIDYEIESCYLIKSIIKNGDIVGLIVFLFNKSISNNEKYIFDLVFNFLDKYLD